jgi:hypothetical protein
MLTLFEPILILNHFNPFLIHFHQFSIHFNSFGVLCHTTTDSLNRQHPRHAHHRHFREAVCRSMAARAYSSLSPPTPDTTVIARRYRGPRNAKSLPQTCDHPPTTVAADCQQAVSLPADAVGCLYFIFARWQRRQQLDRTADCNLDDLPGGLGAAEGRSARFPAALRRFWDGRGSVAAGTPGQRDDRSENHENHADAVS